MSRRTDGSKLNGDFETVLRSFENSAYEISWKLVRDLSTVTERVDSQEKHNTAEDTREETANCEFGIIRARDSFVTYVLFLSLFSFSISLHSSLSSPFPFLRSSVVLLPLVVFSLLNASFLLFLLRFDVVSWGQCLLDRILSRNTPEEEDDLPRYETSNHTRAPRTSTRNREKIKSTSFSRRDSSLAPWKLY